MADLRVKGEYVGPGEERSAKYLAEHLPDDWVIFAGRKLPGPNRDDVDLVIVGRSLIFVVEEKAWGPTVVVDDNFWYVKGNPRPNPLNRVAQVSRIVAGTLRSHVPEYKNLGRAHRAIPIVVMSHQNLQLIGGRDHNVAEEIWPLIDAPERLLQLDSSFQQGSLGLARPLIIKYLDDLPKPIGKPKLGAYNLDARLPSAGQEQVWSAEDATGEHVVLKCYPAVLMSAHGDPGAFLAREYKAINRVAEIGRTWRAFPPFRDDSDQMYVVPVVPPKGGTTLAQMLQARIRDDAAPVDNETARSVAIDAFIALSELHEAGLVHRALHPMRVWLHQKRRVMFSDLNLARIEGDVSIALWAHDGDMSEDYRAPECAANLGLATSKSDVFSLAMCLAQWLLGEEVVELSPAVRQARLEASYPWAASMLASATGPATDRPDAATMAADLSPRPTQPPLPVSTSLGVFDIGGKIADRYRIDRLLGRGGYATSWRVWDSQRDLAMVLKQFHDELPQNARTEFLAAHNLHSDFCGAVYDISPSGAPPYLVSEYVEGESLAANTRAFPVHELREIASCVLKALDYIHGHDLVHGDVTPSNVIASADGSSAKLIDFGLVVRAGELPAGATPKFAAPEVLQGRPATASSDLFSFAITMAFAMLGRSIAGYVDGEYRIDTPAPHELDAWGDEGSRLLQVFIDAAAISVSDRPRSAIELLELLRTTTRTRLPTPGAEAVEFRINPNVASIRRLYRGSAAGNAGNRGLDDAFARDTYVETLLDTALVPKILAGELDVVLLSGNPGDGKTSLLVQIGDGLRRRGATEIHADDAGWRLSLNGRMFLAVFDASESHGDLSANDLMLQALEPVRQSIPAGEPATALIAINDGRLRQFFTDFSDRYEDWWFEIEGQLKGDDAGTSRIVLVDLKRRSLAGSRLDGLADRVLSSLVRDDLWDVCDSCAAQSDCPIRMNQQLLKTKGASAFGELALVSHLRRRRRATFRDVRSAASWVITGDRDCEDVHELVKQGRNTRLMADTLAHDLAFTSSSGDYLVQEWSDLDPALVAEPRVDRSRRRVKTLVQSSLQTAPASAARAIYFGDFATTDIGPDAVRAYRFLPDFLQLLQGVEMDRGLERLLLGISHMVGAPGFRGHGLAFSAAGTGSSWAILHTIPVDSFELDVPHRPQPFVETIPDTLQLKHSSGARFVLTLDTAEMILRAADGELVNDQASDAIKQEIDAFVGQLSRQPSTEAQIVDSSGSLSMARIDGFDVILSIDSNGAR